MQEIQRNRLLKTPFGCKICRKRPPIGLQSMPEGWKMDPQIPCPIGNHFSWGLGYFARQTKLKLTKNFKALFLSLTKNNGKRFLTFRCWNVSAVYHSKWYFYRAPEIYINSLVAKLNPNTQTCKATAKCGSLPPPAECSGESSGLELGYFLSEAASGSYTLDTVASFPFCG